MKYLSCILLLLMSFLAQGQSFYGYQTNRLSVNASAGYSYENFSWSIAGNSKGQNPNVYSELSWKGQEGAIFALDLKYNIYKQFFIEGSFAQKSIAGGNVTDTDYGADNRTNPVFDVKLNTHNGNTSAGMLALGYRFNISSVFNTGLSAGYAINKQSLYLDDADASAQQNLNSNYKADWRGWVIKLSPAVQFSDKITLCSSLAYHQAKYSAKANWNLIEEFEHPLSFRHNANGYGIETGLKVNYKLRSQLSFHIAGNYFTWHTGTGTDQLYLTSGQNPRTQLNEVKRNGYSIMAGLGLNF